MGIGAWKRFGKDLTWQLQNSDTTIFASARHEEKFWGRKEMYHQSARECDDDSGKYRVRDENFT